MLQNIASDFLHLFNGRKDQCSVLNVSNADCLHIRVSMSWFVIEIYCEFSTLYIFMFDTCDVPLSFWGDLGICWWRTATGASIIVHLSFGPLHCRQ